MISHDGSSSLSSFMNRWALVATTLIGLFLGFGICYRTIHHQQEALLEEMHNRHRTALQSFQTMQEEWQKQQNAIQDQQDACLETTQQQTILHAEMTAQLESHRHMARKEYPKLVRQSEKQGTLYQTSQQQVQDLTHQLADQTQLVETLSQEHVTKLESERQAMEEECTAQTTEHEEIIDSLTDQFKECDGDKRDWKNQIQNRQRVLCKEEHGMGPYYVQFSVAFPDDRTQTDETSKNNLFFVVEVASVTLLPHTVFRFLDMVEYGLLDHSTIMTHPTKPIPHRFLMTVKPQHRAARVDDMRTLGFGKTALTFLEHSDDKTAGSSGCGEEHSIGFVGLGPRLQLFLEAPSDDQQGTADVCFGKVVRGADILKQMNDAISRGDQVAITEVKHLIV